MLIWRVNVASQTLRREPASESWERLGGRGLLARILVDEVDATCDPLGPANKLIFAPDLLVGHMLSSCDRISVGGKSPLTGGVKESSAGGRTGLRARTSSRRWGGRRCVWNGSSTAAPVSPRPMTVCPRG